jgi:hypothetical protein
MIFNALDDHLSRLVSQGVRKNEVDGLVILRQELQLGQLEAEIAATDDFIAQVTAKKASL